MTNAIEIRSVTRSYGGVDALDDVSFGVPQHSTVGLFGRSGAGTTTIMSILAEQDRPSSAYGHSGCEEQSR
ncbi:MAG: ATP-binding cassette domain-containing protein [Nesterenkonia sp.]